MKILSVIPLKKGVPAGKLTYFTNQNIPAGHIVAVPFRSKKILSLVVSAQDASETKGDIKSMNFNLKKVAEDKGASIFSGEFLESAYEVSKYFALPSGGALASLLPAIFLEEYDKVAKLLPIPILQEKLIDVNNVRAEKLLFQAPFIDRMAAYKTLIRESFARKKSVFLLLPTELDIEKWHSELARGIEQFTFIMHSGMSAKKILKSFEGLMGPGNHPVLVLCTTPFLSIPKKDVGTIILERENSNAYRTIKKPHLDLRVFAEIYASKIGAKFILADEILRFENIARKEEEHLHSLYPLSFRIDFNGEIDVLERAERKTGDKFKIFEEKCRSGIAQMLAQKKNVFIFSLRKGLATMTVCRDCGDTLLCPRCSSPLTLYLSQKSKSRIFACNRCQIEADSDTKCGNCSSWDLVPLGIGTDTVFEEIGKLFPGVKILKLDKESAKNASSAKKIVRDFEESRGAILVGTEMSLFYLKNKIPLSVIASFETLWAIPSYKMSEKILQIVLRLTELSSEQVFIQTKNASDPALRAIASRNLLPFVREEILLRKKFDYPPYKKFIKISYLGDKDATKEMRKFLSEYFKEYAPEIFSGFVARQKNKYTTNAVLKIEPSKWSLPALTLGGKVDEILYQKLSSLPPPFEVSVDPEDLL